MQVPKWAKYAAICAVEGAIVGLTYVASQPSITEGTLIATGILLLGLALKDLEGQGPASTSSPPAA